VLHVLVSIFVCQCFVTDRKVDEEIGTTKCFQADPDDLLRQIMGFGKGQLHPQLNTDYSNTKGIFLV
jgi:hypothetical protein